MRTLTRPAFPARLRAILTVSTIALTGIVATACGDDDPAGPSGVDITGTYIGELIDSEAGLIPDARLEITSSGTKVTGTFEGGWTGTLNATIIEDAIFEGTFTVTGNCPGTFTTTADIREVARLLGGYNGTDCNGPRNGTYTLERQP